MLDDLISDVPSPKPGSDLPVLVQPEPMAEVLVGGYLKHFAKADANITWLAAEIEVELWLCPDDCEACHGAGYLDGEPCPFSKTVVMGKLDTVGKTEDSEIFFMDLKTASPPPRTRINEWKKSWQMSPQALTYGLLMEKIYPGCRRFTVRKAYKSNPPTFDFEWFRYTTEEIQWWRTEILRTADEIRRLRKGAQPWPPNFQRCFKYGVNYVCPFFHAACSKLDWNGIPEGATLRTQSHLTIENEFMEKNRGSFGQHLRKGIVVLGATKLETYECRERYRRNYEEGGVEEPRAEAKEIGTDFHSLLQVRYQGLIQSK
jgi:PD-(D/E)XK nuclease superfamily